MVGCDKTTFESGYIVVGDGEKKETKQQGLLLEDCDGGCDAFGKR